jgi:hypothetical protein
LHAESLVGRIDEIGVVGGEPVDGDGIPRGGHISLRGWIIAHKSGRPVDELKIRIEGGTAVDAMLRHPRPDVADALARSESLLAGFYAVVPIDAELGTKGIVATAIVDDRQIPVTSETKLEVVRTADPLSGLAERQDDWVFNFDGFFAGERRIDGADPQRTAVISIEELAMLRLWIIDARTARPPVLVFALLGGHYVPVFGGVERPDAAASVGIPTASQCGFNIAIVPALACTSMLQVYAIAVDGTYFRLPPIAVRPREPFPSEFLSEDALVTASVDEICVGTESFRMQERVVATQGAPIVIRGWAVDECGPRLVASIEARIDQVRVLQAEPGEARPDVAELFGNTLLSVSGFKVSFETSKWLPGEHSVSLSAFSSHGNKRKTIADFTVAIEP